MQKLVTIAVYFGVQAVLLAFLASWAFGASAYGAPDGRVTEVKAVDPNQIEVKGTLICHMGTENTGQPCALQIEEEGTGRVYQLAGSDSAMRLYFDGIRRASVEGRRNGDATSILVKRVSAL